MTRSASARLALPSLAAALLLVLTLAAPSGAAVPSKATWSRDVTQYLATKKAQATLDERVKQGIANGETMAMNMDIDNTSIATYYAYPDAVPQVLALAQRYRAQDVKLLFNTGRYSDQLTDIKKALSAAGYRYTWVCGRQRGLTIQEGKERCRSKFIDRGYSLIANFGNNYTDFRGPVNWDYGFDLPDYDKQLS